MLMINASGKNIVAGATSGAVTGGIIGLILWIFHLISVRTIVAILLGCGLLGFIAGVLAPEKSGASEASDQ